MGNHDDLKWITPLKNRPNLFLDEESIRVMETKIRNGHEKRRNKKLNLIFIASIPALLALLFAFIIWAPFSNNALYEDYQKFVAGEIISEEHQWDHFEREIKLPTYIPFDVDGVILNTIQRGPMELMDGELVYLEEGNPEYQEINIRYLKEGEMALEIYQTDTKLISLENTTFSPAGEVIKIRSNLEGYYSYNGAVQMLYWQENGVFYHMSLSKQEHSNNEQKDPPFPIEELINIAQSFLVYKHKVQ